MACSAWACLDREGAARAVAHRVAQSILGQIDRAYPCFASQVLACPEDLCLPVDRHPAFFGSFDWHSCVHSHWALARLVAEGLLGDDDAALAVDCLDRHLSLDLLAREAQSWRDIPEHVERPYGLTWLLALDLELARPELAAHAGWGKALRPLVEVLFPRVTRWVDGLMLPVRSGIHSDTAWSLAMAWDWSVGREGGARLAKSVCDAARRLYLGDVGAPCAYEPQADTFSSSILNEAALMARVLDVREYLDWLRGFLPALFGEAGDGSLADASAPLLGDVPGTWDGSNYLGVHEVALPLSRSLAARDAASSLPECPARGRLVGEASRWAAQGIDGLCLEGYLADHWVGSFAVAVVAGAR